MIGDFCPENFENFIRQNLETFQKLRKFRLVKLGDFCPEYWKICQEKLTEFRLGYLET